MRLPAVICLAIAATGVSAQPGGHGTGHMGRQVLFLARATAGEVVPAQSSAATATAAVIIDSRGNRVRFDITFNGLERGPPSRIGLYNFGAGGNGATVALLCGGGGSRACPDRPAARFAGSLEQLRLDGDRLSEFASGRVYLQIDGGDGRPEIRGQLDANGAMTPSRVYLAQLVPGAPGATGEGTAILSETRLPGGRVAVEYSVTVAGTSGAPRAVALVGANSAESGRGARFVKSAQLPSPRRAFNVVSARGGSFSGDYIARRGHRSELVSVAVAGGTRKPALAVRTSRFPNGELVGVFEPVE